MGLNMAGAAVIIPDASDGTDPENPYGDGIFQSCNEDLQRFWRNAL